MTSPFFLPRPGPWGWSLPVPWLGSGVPSCHAGLQGQRAPGTGLGGAGATTSSPVPDFGKEFSFWEAGHSFLATSVPLSPSPPLFFLFSPLSEGVWGEGRRGSRTLSFVSGVIGWPSASVPCASHSHQLFVWTPVPFPVCGEWSARAAEGTECLSHSPWPGKEEWGMGTVDFSVLCQTTFSFLLGLMSLFTWETGACSSL